jgi:RNA polymerase sigma-70 factor (ECF subfamily)
VPSADDADLAQRAVTGDADAFVELVRRHQAAAVRLARVLGPPDDAEDAVQEAFMKAHRALDTFDPARPFGPWLLAIVANQARDRGRGARRRSALLQRAVALQPRGSAHSAEELALQRIGPERLVAALAALGRDERETILLRYVLDHSEEQTAAILGVARGTVKSRSARGLARLRATLGEVA